MTIFRLVQLSLLLIVAVALSTPADAQRRSGRAPAQEVMFPDATRKDEAPKTSARFNKQFQRMIELSNKDQFEESLAISLEIINDAKATPADRATALQNASYNASQLDRYEESLEYAERAVNEDALGNNAHFQLMRQVGQMRIQEEQYQEGIALLDRFMAETKTRNPELLALKGNAYYRMERYDDAVTALTEAISLNEEAPDSWRQLLMATYVEMEKPTEAAALAEQIAGRAPDDKRAQHNLAAIYAQTDQYDQATRVLEQMRAKGMFTEERDYRQLYAMYFNMDGQEAKVIEVINDGLQKGVLANNADALNALAQAYYFSDRFDEAIDTYRKASTVATDGEPGLNLARLLSNEERSADAKAAAQEAIARGVRRPGDAWMIIARSEHDLNNRAGMIAAYREAAKFEETRDQAQEWLRKNASR
jgi:tetratricopeptide (TPR) repeat protein